MSKLASSPAAATAAASRPQAPAAGAVGAARQVQEQEVTMQVGAGKVARVLDSGSEVRGFDSPK